MSRSLLVCVSFVAGVIVLPLAVFLYIAYGHPPVAAGDTPFPLEAQIVKIPLNKRIEREMPANSPIPASDENLNAGASIYEDKCEMCHGAVGQPSAIGSKMFPQAPQFCGQAPKWRDESASATIRRARPTGRSRMASA